MPYWVAILARDGREEFRLFKDLAVAENRYFRAFAAVINREWVEAEHLGHVRLVSCCLYEVPTENITPAKEMVANNEARRLQSSDDCCGSIVIEGLFRTIN